MSDICHTQPLTEVPLAAACEVLNKGYEHYVMPIKFDVSALVRRIQAEDIDLFASRLLLEDGGRPAGIMLIARRGRVSRLAALGIVPEQRGVGLGTRAVALAIAEARARGDLRMILEVIETNAPAVATYSKAGFVPQRRLVGYAHEPVLVETGAEACQIDEALPVLLSAYPPNPSWQTSPLCFAGTTAPLDAVRTSDGSATALVDGTGATARLLAFAVTRAARQRGLGRSFMKAVLGRFPDKPWVISATLPEDQASAFLVATGWKPSALAQLEMELALDRSGITV
jgi:GNAT superfamily N-acetyltransferase